MAQFLLLLRKGLGLPLFLLRLSQLQRLLPLLGKALFPALQLRLKFPVPYLLNDLRVAGFIHLEYLTAVRAFDLLHCHSSLFVFRYYNIFCQNVHPLCRKTPRIKSEVFC